MYKPGKITNETNDMCICDIHCLYDVVCALIDEEDDNPRMKKEGASGFVEDIYDRCIREKRKFSYLRLSKRQIAYLAFIANDDFSVMYKKLQAYPIRKANKL